MSVKRNLAKPFQRRLISTLIIAATSIGLNVQAAPSGGVVTGGQGNIAQADAQTTITQDSARLSIDWDSFDVAADEQVRFVQPGRESIALNRILSNSGSEILGRLDANGRVILVNPHGLTFGEGAEIRVGDLIASGLEVDPSEFMNGDLVFSDNGVGNALVRNSGLIEAASGGNVALLGAQVANEGVIAAELGSIQLASGDQMVLNFDADGLLGIRVDEATLRDLGAETAVLNSGELKATAGTVLLSSQAGADLFTRAVNTGGEIDSTEVTVHDDGSFTLNRPADVVNSGLIDVSYFLPDSDSRLTEEVSMAVALRGRNTHHSGQILAGIDYGGNIWESTPSVWEYFYGSSVLLTGANSVSVDGGEIRSGLLTSTDMDVYGEFISVKESYFHGNRSSEVNIGDIENTESVFVDDGSTVDGSDVITVASRTLTHVRGTLDASARAEDSTAYITGGTIHLASAGQLGVSGRLDAGTNSINGESGPITLQADDLVIGDSDTGIQIGPRPLEADGHVILDATNSVTTTPGTSFTAAVDKHLTVLAGAEDERDGLIDLRAIKIESQGGAPDDNYARIDMEAGEIFAPAIGREPGNGHGLKFLSVSLTANNGDIVHDRNVSTHGVSDYVARASNSIIFNESAALNTDHRNEAYSGPAELYAGNRIILRSSNRYGETDDDTDLYMEAPFVSFTQTRPLENADIDSEVVDSMVGRIVADNLQLTTLSDESSLLSIQVDISGETTIDGRAGGNLRLLGELNNVGVEVGDGLNLVLQSAENLDLVTAVETDHSFTVNANVRQDTRLVMDPWWTGPAQVRLDGSYNHLRIEEADALDLRVENAVEQLEVILDNNARNRLTDVQASVTGDTFISANERGNVRLVGDINRLHGQLASDSQLRVNDPTDIALGRIVLEDSDMTLHTAGEFTRIYQDEFSYLDLTSSNIKLRTGYIDLGAEGTGSVAMSGDEGSAIRGRFKRGLSLNGRFDYGSDKDRLVFTAGGNANRVDVGEYAEFIGVPKWTGYGGRIDLSNMNQTINLHADLPLVLNLGHGRDTINEFGYSLDNRLQNFDSEKDVIVTYGSP